MQSILATCTPRPDIIAGSFNPEIFTASLSQVMEAYQGRYSSTDTLYTDAGLFFREATFPTEGLRRVIGDVFGRLAGDNSLPAIHRLETGFGGGKTHTLISLVHLAYKGQSIANAAREVISHDLLQPEGAIAVVGIACDEMPVIEPSGEQILPYTLWGEIALRLAGESFYRENLKEVTSTAFPGKYFLERLFVGRKVLIMLDELAQYATRYEAAHLGGGEQLGAFLMALLGYARTHADIAVIVTLASQQDAFRQQTGMLAGILSQTLGRKVDQDEAEALAQKAGNTILSVVSRDATSTVPVRATEISRVLARRLFTRIDTEVAQQTAQRYMAMYQKSGAQLPEQANRADFEQVIVNNYPFHPSFIRFLTDKLATAPNFHGTRGVLRVLAMAIRSLWQTKRALPLIHTSHLALANPQVADELIGRTGASDLMAVLNADVGGADSGNLDLGVAVAQMLDRRNPHPDGLPLYEWAWKVVFLHSLVGRTDGLASNVFGVTLSEALFETAMPNMTPPQVETALQAITTEAYYLRDKDGRYFAHTDPTEARIVSTIKQGLKADDISEHLNTVSRKVVSHHSQTFKVAQDVATPQDIADKQDMPVLALIRLDAKRIDAEQMIISCGDGRPRIQQNYVFMLVPDCVQVEGEVWGVDRNQNARRRMERLEDLARTVIAMRKLEQRPENYGMTAAKLLESGFKDALRKREMDMQTAVSQAYDAIYFPGASGAMTKKTIKQAGGEGGAAVDAEILRVLSDEGELITQDKANTNEILLQLAQLFFNLGQTPAVQQIREQFAQNRRWPILENRTVLGSLLQAGVEKGHWCLFRFESSEASKPEHFHSRDTGTLPMNMDWQQTGWKLVSMPGALQRGWNPEAEPDPQQVETWVSEVIKQQQHATVAAVVAAVKQQHGSMQDKTVLDAVDQVIQKGKVYTYGEFVDDGIGEENPDLKTGSQTYFYKVRPEDHVITPAKAAEKGWIAVESQRFTLNSHALAQTLHQNLGRLGSLYSRGASTKVDTLRLFNLKLSQGGSLHIDLEKVSPKEMKELAELFEVLANVTTLGQDTLAQVDIHEPPEACAFMDLIKQAK